MKHSLRTEGAFNSLREDTTPGSSGDRILYSNRWAVEETLLQSMLDNWAVSQELWDVKLEVETGSEIRGQVIGVQTQMQSFKLHFGIQLRVLVLMHTINIASTI